MFRVLCVLAAVLSQFSFCDAAHASGDGLRPLYPSKLPNKQITNDQLTEIANVLNQLNDNNNLFDIGPNYFTISHTMQHQNHPLQSLGVGSRPSVPASPKSVEFHEWSLTTFVLLYLMGGSMGSNWYPAALMLTAMACTNQADGNPLRSIACFF
eukprot:c8317_g1_i1.p1 GENE.c8317_g1_i1~~c8317_g1_i1.p1  ORF type:complete len:154 (+),score=31.69 c8317_g1_i1:38-499(+)